MLESQLDIYVPHLGEANLGCHSVVPSCCDEAGSKFKVQTRIYKSCLAKIVTEFWEGDATKQKSVKRSAFSLNKGKAIQ